MPRSRPSQIQSHRSPKGSAAIALAVDRPRSVQPQPDSTNCAPKPIEATVTGNQDAVASPGAFYQVANCASLPFGPKLILHLSGGLHRLGHPAIHAMLSAGPVKQTSTASRSPFPPRSSSTTRTSAASAAKLISPRNPAPLAPSSVGSKSPRRCLINLCRVSPTFVHPDGACLTSRSTSMDKSASKQSLASSS